MVVAGSGPCSLSFAGDMAKRGYVTLCMRHHEIGGVLKYGIPDSACPTRWWMPNSTSLRDLGVKFIADTIVGKTLSYDDLDERGLQRPYSWPVAPVCPLHGHSGRKLHQHTVVQRIPHPHQPDARQYPGLYATLVPRGANVAVIGGGNTAMDSVRTALRMGAKKAMPVYRRSEEEMPARREEVLHAGEERA